MKNIIVLGLFLLSSITLIAKEIVIHTFEASYESKLMEGLPTHIIKPRRYAGKIIIDGNTIKTECMDEYTSEKVKRRFYDAIENGISFTQYPKLSDSSEETIKIRGFWYGWKDVNFPSITYRKGDKDFDKALKSYLFGGFPFLIEVKKEVIEKKLYDGCLIPYRNREVMSAMRPYNFTDDIFYMLGISVWDKEEDIFFASEHLKILKKYGVRSIKDILKDKTLYLYDEKVGKQDNEKTVAMLEKKYQEYKKKTEEGISLNKKEEELYNSLVYLRETRINSYIPEW